MIWVILAALSVPAWRCAAAILTLVLRKRALRKRAGNVSARARTAGKTRWSPGHGVLVHDVFAFRGLSAARKEELVWATEATCGQ